MAPLRAGLLAAALASGAPMEVPAATGSVEIGDGISLAYVERGTGEPVVLIHGSLADLTYWQQSRQIDLLAEHYRVIAYSRRYNHPNRNAPAGDHSPIVEAADLGRFLTALELGPVHLVGHSYGAYTALAFALDHPDRVRTLVLAEPPIISWLPETHAGFMANVWEPMAAAFRESDAAGLEYTAQWYFGKPFEEIEPAWQTLFRDNVVEWRELTRSPDTFPDLDHDRVRALRIPTLVLSGGKSAGGFNDRVDALLTELIPGARRVIIPDASHEMFLDFPEASARAMAEHFGERPTPAAARSSEAPVVELPAEEEARALRRAERVGEAIHRHDRAAWHATHAVRRLRQFNQPRQARGWITEATDGAVVVTFVDLDRNGEPIAAFRATVTDGEQRARGAQAVRQPAPLTAFERAAFEANQIARSQEFNACSDRYNTVTLPPEEEGGPWSVYLLPATTQRGRHIVGGSHRFSVDVAAGALLETRTYTYTCFVLADQPQAVALFMTHVMDPVPTEIHVFAQRAIGKPLYVGTSPHGTIWAISDGTIRLVDRKSAPTGDAK